METHVVSKAWLKNSEGKVLLLRRSSTDKRRPLEWDIPGGHVEIDESPEQAAARETLEEAGIILKTSDLSLVYAMTEIPSDGVSVTWLFYVADVNSSDVVLSEEHEESAWVIPSKALDMIKYDRQKRALAYITQNNLLTANN